MFFGFSYFKIFLKVFSDITRASKHIRLMIPCSQTVRSTIASHNWKNEFLDLSFYDPFWILLLLSFLWGYFCLMYRTHLKPILPFLKCPVPSTLISPVFLNVLIPFQILFGNIFACLFFIFNFSSSLMIIFFLFTLANTPNIAASQRNSPVLKNLALIKTTALIAVR